VWKLSGLLRGQLGTGDAMEAGAATGAPFVLIDSAVVKAGLAREQAGLSLNWRVGPVGHDFGGDSYVERTVAGGLRALTPLAPVHLRMKRTGGDAEITWVRRGRVDADSWLAEDIPLGEEFERYRIEVAPAGGAVVRTAESDAPHWTYAAADITADLGGAAGEIDVTVHQISARIGAGLKATRRFSLA
jgi:hypothetical protein